MDYNRYTVNEGENNNQPKGTVIIYGFLQKKSKYIHLWKTRFFILTDHYLFAFTGIENDADCTMALALTSVISVDETECNKNNKKGFVIRSISNNYFLRAEEHVVNKWIKKIKENINQKNK